MPTPISHAAVGFAVAAWTQPAPPRRQLCLIAAACAALPDIDYLGWPVPHRSITHSIAFAVTGALVALALSKQRRTALVLLLAFLSHGLLDGFSSYSFGIEYFAPFSSQRFRWGWTPLGSADGSLAAQLVQEAVVVLIPALALSWLAFKLRRERPAGAVAA